MFCPDERLSSLFLNSLAERAINVGFAIWLNVIRGQAIIVWIPARESRIQTYKLARQKRVTNGEVSGTETVVDAFSCGVPI